MQNLFEVFAAQLTPDIIRKAQLRHPSIQIASTNLGIYVKLRTEIDSSDTFNGEFNLAISPNEISNNEINLGLQLTHESAEGEKSKILRLALLQRFAFSLNHTSLIKPHGALLVGSHLNGMSIVHMSTVDEKLQKTSTMLQRASNPVESFDDLPNLLQNTETIATLPKNMQRHGYSVCETTDLIEIMPAFYEKLKRFLLLAPLAKLPTYLPEEKSIYYPFLQGFKSD